MKELVVYEFEGVTFTPTWINGDPWFLASEVAKILRFKDIHKQVNRLPDSEKGRTISPTLGGAQEVLIVSEIGLYKLCFASRSPFAVKFQDWVANLVKQIREHGFVIDKDRADPAKVQRALDEWKAAFGREPRGGVVVNPHDGAILERRGDPITVLSIARAEREAAEKRRAS